MASNMRESLELIAQDAELDASTLDGKPFSARVVAEQFGAILASIKALATHLNTVRAMVEERGEDPSSLRDNETKLLRSEETKKATMIVPIAKIGILEQLSKIAAVAHRGNVAHFAGPPHDGCQRELCVMIRQLHQGVLELPSGKGS